MTEQARTQDTVFAELLPLAAKHFKVEASTLTPATLLREDLRADSLDLVLLVHDLEDHFGIVVSQESLTSIKSLGDAASMIASAPRR
jgi:acyl carrier protein